MSRQSVQTPIRVERTYAEVRDELRDGDAVLFRGSVLASRIIQRISGGRHSHAAVVLEWGGYAKLDLLRVGAHLLFHLGLPRYLRDPEALFCSQYVSRCFRTAGLDLASQSDVGTSPEHISSSRWLRYAGTIPHDPRRNPVRHVDDIPELRTVRMRRSLPPSARPS